MIVAGIGFRLHAPASAIEAAIEQALEVSGLNRQALGAIATAAEKIGEPGACAVAERWGLALVAVTAEEMQLVSAGSLTSSIRVQALKGVPSVAETTALAAAGRAARLLCARVTNSHAACAIAIGDGQSETPGGTS